MGGGIAWRPGSGGARGLGPVHHRGLGMALEVGAGGHVVGGCVWGPVGCFGHDGLFK